MGMLGKTQKKIETILASGASLNLYEDLEFLGSDGKGYGVLMSYHSSDKFKVNDKEVFIVKGKVKDVNVNDWVYIDGSIKKIIGIETYAINRSPDSEQIEPMGLMVKGE